MLAESQKLVPLAEGPEMSAPVELGLVHTTLPLTVAPEVVSGNQYPVITPESEIPNALTYWMPEGKAKA